MRHRCAKEGGEEERCIIMAGGSRADLNGEIVMDHVFGNTRMSGRWMRGYVESDDANLRSGFPNNQISPVW